MKSRDPVDRVAAHARQMRHAHVSAAVFVDQREAPRQLLVSRKPLPHVVQEAAVDLINDLEVPRQEGAEERQGPLLEGFGQQRVVRVPTRPLCDRPGLIPVHQVLVHEQPHQLGHGDGRVRVVQLRGPTRIELVQRLPSCQVKADHVLQGAGDEEELLRQTELFSRYRFVVRVQHLRDGFGRDLLIDRTVVIADIERLEVERLGGLGLPQPQQVRGGPLVPGIGVS